MYHGNQITSKKMPNKKTFIIPARDPKQCGGSKKVMHYKLDDDDSDDGDDEDDDDDDDE